MFTLQIIGKKIIHCPEVDSTQDEAKRLIKKGVSEGTVVVADSQAKGRGRPGNSWYSPLGGAYLSAVVKPFKNPKDLSPITILGAKAAVSAVEKISNLKVEIKLPNDIIVNSKKAGGVLVERVASGYLIIGIGVNINNEKGSFPKEIENTATSLKIETGRNYETKKFIEILISELDREYLAYLKKV